MDITLLAAESLNDFRRRRRIRVDRRIALGLCLRTAPELTESVRHSILLARQRYTKYEDLIPMRDGVKLFTQPDRSRKTSKSAMQRVIRSRSHPSDVEVYVLPAVCS